MKSSQRHATFRIALLIFLSLIGAYCFATSGDQDDRPNVYPSWGQFTVCDSLNSEPRVVTIRRLGAGPQRPAEYFVYEVVENGKRLRQLYQSQLQCEYDVWGKFSLGDGRFLVAIGSRIGGDPARSISVYDFARKASKSWMLHEFLPESVTRKLDVDLVYPGPHWWSGLAAFDQDRLLFFPNRVEECRENGYPLVTVDLLSQSVEFTSTPNTSAIEAQPVGRIARGVVWDWSLGNSSEPSWGAPFCLPAYLLAVVKDVPRLTVVGLDEPRILFRLDPATRDYHRCSPSEWVDRKAEKK